MPSFSKHWNQLDKASFRGDSLPGGCTLGAGSRLLSRSCWNQSISRSGASFLPPHLPQPPCLRGQRMRSWVGTGPSSVPGTCPACCGCQAHSTGDCGKLWPNSVSVGSRGRSVALGQRKVAVVDMAVLVSDSSWSGQFTASLPGPMGLPPGKLGLPGLFPPNMVTSSALCTSLHNRPGLCGEVATWRALDPSPGPSIGHWFLWPQLPEGQAALSQPRGRAAALAKQVSPAS